MKLPAVAGGFGGHSLQSLMAMAGAVTSNLQNLTTPPEPIVNRFQVPLLS